jgi:hypothetical protein
MARPITHGAGAPLGNAAGQFHGFTSVPGLAQHQDVGPSLTNLTQRQRHNAPFWSHHHRKIGERHLVPALLALFFVETAVKAGTD